MDIRLMPLSPRPEAERRRLDGELRKFSRQLQSAESWSSGDEQAVRVLVKDLQSELDAYLVEASKNLLFDSGAVAKLQAQIDFAGADDKILYEAAKKKVDAETVDWRVVLREMPRVEGVSAVQDVGDVATLYQEAWALHPGFSRAVESVRDAILPSPKLTVASLKHLYRIIEKAKFSTKFPDQADGVLDVVRCVFECDNTDQMARVFKAVLESETLEIVRGKDRWRYPTPGGWADIMLNVRVRGGPNRTPIRSTSDILIRSNTRRLAKPRRSSRLAGHIAEIQIVHTKMIVMREGMGTHETYAKLRAGAETLKKLDLHRAERVAERVVSDTTRTLEVQMAAATKSKDWKLLKRLKFDLARARGTDIERVRLQTLLDEAEAREDYDSCETLQEQLDALDSGAALVTPMPASAPAPALDDDIPGQVAQLKDGDAAGKKTAAAALKNLAVESETRRAVIAAAGGIAPLRPNAVISI